MELKLKRVSRKYLLPAISFSALAITVLIAGFTMATAPSKQSVLVAREAIAEGQSLTSHDFTMVSLPIGNLAANYVSDLKPGLVAVRPIAKGELITNRVLAPGNDERIPIRLNNLPQISKAISVGDVVDVWSTPMSGGMALTPEPAAFNAIVTAIETNSSMAQITNAVELRIYPEYLETLLQVTDSNYKISLILQETLSDLE
ncbi:MAG: hypothetical protein RLZZ380_460 [Actinomycetota bacterium]|jgi:hypothetical protein